MVRLRASEGGVQRLANKKSGSTRKHVSARRRTKKGNTLTTLQKAQLKIQRQDRTVALNEALDCIRDEVWQAAKKLHADFQTHSSEYYYRLIMQSTRLKSCQRKTSRWNAYLSRELHRRNAGKPPRRASHLPLKTREPDVPTDVPDGGDRVRVSDSGVAREIGEQWKAMSKEEQEAATEDALVELQERHESHKRGTHTVPIQAFHDTRATLASIQRELEDLHARTGTEILLFAVRSDLGSFNTPFCFWSDDRLMEFVTYATKLSVDKFVMKMESFCISGMQGVAFNYVQGLLKLKQDAAVLINNKLKEACTRGIINRMAYVNFDARITARVGVVVENWPLKRFCAPGEICSRPELDTLIQAFTTGAARFRSLSDAEWASWKLSSSGGAVEAPQEDQQSTPAPGTASVTQTSSPTPSSSPATDPPIPALTAVDDAHSTPADPPRPSLSTSDPGTPSPTAVGVAPQSPATTPVGDVTTGSISVGVHAAASAPDVSTRAQARTGMTFITTSVVTGADGRTTVQVAKRPRKPRKGKSNDESTEPAQGQRKRKKTSKSNGGAEQVAQFDGGVVMG